MKQFEILSGRCLVVELPPEWTQEVQPSFGINHDYLWYIVKCENERFHAKDKFLKLPPGNWRIIGMLSEVAEDGLDGLIKPVKVFDYDAHYWNYKDKEYQPIRVDESLESAILAEGFTFQNNLRNPDDVCYFSRDRMIADVREYHEAQSRVLCRERCLLLGREG